MDLLKSNYKSAAKQYVAAKAISDNLLVELKQTQSAFLSEMANMDFTFNPLTFTLHIDENHGVQWINDKIISFYLNETGDREFIEYHKGITLWLGDNGFHNRKIPNSYKLNFVQYITDRKFMCMQITLRRIPVATFHF